MWRYQDSDSETAFAHCNYCGQTCANRRHLGDDLGVCSRCSRVLSRLTDPLQSSSTMSAELEASSASTIEDVDMDIGRSDETETLSILSEGDANDQSEDQSEGHIALCPRCWKNPPTTKLYDVPICKGCLQQANEQKVSHRPVRVSRVSVS
jgi:hypothetical protein